MGVKTLYSKIKTMLVVWRRWQKDLERNDALNDPIRYIVSDSKRIAYITNSKVACSSIRLSFVEEDVEIPDDYSIHLYVRKHGYEKLELTDDQQKYFIFTFVRNPFDRLVSCYESKYHTDKDMKNYFDFSVYLDKYLYYDRGFNNFLYRVMMIPSRLMDRHFNVQSLLVYRKDGSSRCNFVGHFENINEEYKEIQEKYGLKPLPHYNNSGSRNWMDYYNPLTARLVYWKYRQDFKNFGYEDSYKELKKYMRNKKRSSK